MLYRHHPMIASAVRKGVLICTTALLSVAVLPLTSVHADTLKPEKKVGTMTTAPMKSNGSGVIVQYRLEGTPQVGAPTTVVLTLDGVTDPAGASLRVQTEGGLALGSAPATATLPTGTPTTLTIDVTPATEGTAYLHVFTTQYGATSATSIPVQVGKNTSTKPTASDLKQAPNGEKIRSMQVK